MACFFGRANRSSYLFWIVVIIATMAATSTRAEPMIVAPHIDGHTVSDYLGSYDDPEVAIRKARPQPWCANTGCWSYLYAKLAPRFQYDVIGYWLWTYSDGTTVGPISGPYSTMPLIACPTGYSPAVSAPAYDTGIYFGTAPYQKYNPVSLWVYATGTNPYSPPYFAACVRNSKSPDPSPARSPGETCSGASSAPETPLIGNPCNAATGNKYERETDYAGAGQAALQLQRYYNSVPAPLGMFGQWRSNYDGRVVTSPLGVTDPGYYQFPDGYLNKYLNYPQPLLRSVALERPDGKTFWFTQWSGGAWTSDPDVPGTLTGAASSGWVYTLRDGTVETYDTSGKLARITDRTGLSQTLTYSSGGLASVTDAFGHSLRFGYDSTTGQLATLTDPAGQSTLYSYAAGNLSRVDYPNGTAKLYHYDDSRFPGHLTGISHVEATGTTNRFATFTYDATGKAASTEHAGGMEKFSISYDLATQSTVTDAAGTQERMTFTTNFGVKNLVYKYNLSAGGSLTQTFDTRNNLTCKIDEAGRVTTFAYTGIQKVSMTEGQSGNCTTLTVTPTSRTTTYQYLSPTLDLPTLIQSPSVAGGSNTKQINIAYDANRNPVTITQSGFTPAGAAVSRSIALGYNGSGQVTSIDGPRTDVADVTTVSYYTCTTGGACGQIQSVTNAPGQTTTYDSYDANGRALSITDPNGLKVVYNYDPRGRVGSITQTAPGEASRLTQYGYNVAGNVTSVSLPSGLALSYTYDAALKLRRVTDSLNNRVDYNYDLKGNRTQAYSYDPSGALTRAIDLAYDARNRVSSLNAGGSITKQVWDAVGNLTISTDPNTVAKNGAVATINSYDSLNRLFQTVDCGYALSGSCFLVNGNTQYGYDVNDRVKTAQAPNGSLTQYAYDDLGNLLSETSPDRGVTTYSHDPAGNVVSLKDARNITVGYGYDALNRLTRVDYPGSDEDVTYTYDSATGCSAGLGRLCRVQDAAGVSDYAYDGFGNVANHLRTELGVAYTTRYTYDAGNRVMSVAYPNGRLVNTTRNTKGDIEAASMTLRGVTTALLTGGVFRPDGLPTSRSFGNNLTDTRVYDTQGRLRELYLGSADTRLFSYDANGNLTGKQTLPEVGAYTYDTLNRLNKETRTTQSAVTTTWTYDPNGNRKSQNTGSYAYLTASNRLTTALSSAIALDAAGNTLSDSTRSYTYNHAGQLSDVAGASYRYNSQHQRTRKIVGSQATVFHYDLQGNLIAETTADGNLIRDYVWVDAIPIAQIEAGERIAYLHTDHLNTPRLATNPQGQVLWRWEGTAFGETYPSEDSDGDGVKTTINLRYPGQYWDQETGLHYNWNRYYDPKIGRYVTSDPIGLKGGLNTYLYARANPLKFTDPTGLLCVYSQNTHSLTCTSDTTGQQYLQCNGYAGIGSGLNNSNAQNQPFVGPLPQGDYTVGGPFSSDNMGPVTRPLIPDPNNNMFGRYGFFIHGDNDARNNTASKGCPILSRSCREGIPTGETFRVVP